MIAIYKLYNMLAIYLVYPSIEYMLAIYYTKTMQGTRDRAKVDSQRDTVRAGTEKIERNSQRDRYSEPPAADLTRKLRRIKQ